MSETTTTATTDETGREKWIAAGRGWGARAAEWAYLFEPYALPANQLLFDRLDVGPTTRLLDVACGSGFAASIARRREPRSAGSMLQRR